MKIITGTAVALAISTTVASVCLPQVASAQIAPGPTPVPAPTPVPGAPVPGRINEEVALERDQFQAAAPSSPSAYILGQIQSIEEDGRRMVVRTSDGNVRTYEVTRGTVNALRLAPGQNIEINPFAIRTGYLRNISMYRNRTELTRPSDPTIRDASGGVEAFYLAPPNQRHLFTAGNQVAIWPTGELEKLSNRVDGLLDVQNVRVVYPAPVIAYEQVEQRTVQVPPTPAPAPYVPPTPAPAPAPVPAPSVPALW